MGRPVAMFEIVSAQPARAKEFYAGLFEWSVDEDPEWGGYALVDTASDEASIPGGIGPSMADGDTGVKIYVRVDDLPAYLERAERLGGQRLVEPTELPGGFGTFAVLADPDGNPVGLWA